MLDLRQKETLNAKLKELANWKANKVYEEVVDSGQERVSTRWVMSEKVEGNEV